MTSAPLDRDSFVPMYYQLQQALVREIESGRYPPGDRIPSETELGETFDVSRTVIRQALRELEVAGRIVRRKGHGSFVATPKTSESLVQSLTGLHEDVTARGGTLRSEVRRLEASPASAAVAEELELAPEVPVIVLDRLRFVDEVPWVAVTTYLPYDLCPGILDEDFTTQSLYTLLETTYGVRIAYGRRRVEAVPAPAPVARSLGVHRRDPILLLTSTSYDPQGRPVEHFLAQHRGDLSQFEVQLERRRGGAPRPTITVRPPR